MWIYWYITPTSRRVACELLVHNTTKHPNQAIECLSQITTFIITVTVTFHYINFTKKQQSTVTIPIPQINNKVQSQLHFTTPNQYLSEHNTHENDCSHNCYTGNDTIHVNSLLHQISIFHNTIHIKSLFYLFQNRQKGVDLFHFSCSTLKW